MGVMSVLGGGVAEVSSGFEAEEIVQFWRKQLPPEVNVYLLTRHCRVGDGIEERPFRESGPHWGDAGRKGCEKFFCLKES